VKYRFRDCELDAAHRTLRRGGVAVEVQPLVLELLLYLVCHRDRVVPSWSSTSTGTR
jgi:DNA-binding winged helix-turn-helix (wHTH) protein